MTRDAKIGLLLGLVFIFIIAFIINGLPSLGRDDGNELTRNMARPQRAKPGIASDAKQVTQRTITPVKPASPPAAPESVTAQPQVAQTATDQVRFETPLPQPTTTTIQSAEPTAAVSNPVAVLVPAVQQKEPVVIQPKPQPARMRIYTVQEGDSLASIAKQFYGEELGNKKVNVDRIFKTNSKILKSPDEIYVGQKLIIPPLTDTDSAKPENVLPAESFKPVDSIGKTGQNQVLKPTDKTRYYTVKEGDNLWKIASEQLGNGSRYPELAKINNIKDEDLLVVGARLKLP